MHIGHIDTCNSQYFGGHHLPWFNIHIDPTTTYADLKETMLDAQTTEHLECLDAVSEEDFALAVNVTFAEVADMGSVIDTTLEAVIDEDNYDCYAYFVIDL